MASRISLASVFFDGKKDMSEIKNDRQYTKIIKQVQIVDSKWREIMRNS